MIGFHELYLVQSLIQMVQHSAREKGIGRVTRIKLSVGERAAALPSALEFAFRVLREESLLSEAELEIEVSQGYDLMIDYYEGEEAGAEEDADEGKTGSQHPEGQ